MDVDSKLTCPVYVAHDLSGVSSSLVQLRAEIVSRLDGAADLGGQAATMSRGSFGLHQLAILVVSRQAPGTMEHGQGAIRIDVDPDRDLQWKRCGSWGICRLWP